MTKVFHAFFSKKALKNKSITYYFMNSFEKKTEREEFVNQIIKYTKFIKTTPLKERILSPLVVFVKPESKKSSLRKHQEMAWYLIQFLHENDIAKWPDNIPSDPESHLWSFCFNEFQLFINISSPYHVRHVSRNVGNSLSLIINPRENFDYVAGINTKKGERIRKTIRRRQHSYDGKTSENLGFYGDPKNMEWKQYHVYEEGWLPLIECPFMYKK